MACFLRDPNDSLEVRFPIFDLRLLYSSWDEPWYFQDIVKPQGSLRFHGSFCREGRSISYTLINIRTGGSKDVVYTTSLLVHDVGCLFVMDVVLLWLGKDKREQNHENNGTTGTMIASDFYGGSGEYSST